MTFGSYAYKINLIPKLIFLNFRFFLKKLRLDAVKKKKKVATNDQTRGQ
jgi:hypothetical protein